MNILEINGVVVPQPNKGVWDDSTLSTADSGRDLGNNATMHNDIITVKKSLPYEWPCLNATNTAILLQAIKLNGFDDINIKTHNPELNTMQTYNCYVGDRHVPIGFIKDDVIYYDGITMTFIEN